MVVIVVIHRPSPPFLLLAFLSRKVCMLGTARRRGRIKDSSPHPLALPLSLFDLFAPHASSLFLSYSLTPRCPLSAVRSPLSRSDGSGSGSYRSGSETLLMAERTHNQPKTELPRKNDLPLFPNRDKNDKTIKKIRNYGWLVGWLVWLDGWMDAKRKKPGNAGCFHSQRTNPSPPLPEKKREKGGEEKQRTREPSFFLSLRETVCCVVCRAVPSALSSR